MDFLPNATFPDLKQPCDCCFIISLYLHRYRKFCLNRSPTAKIKTPLTLAVQEFGSQTCFTKDDQSFSSHGPSAESLLKKSKEKLGITHVPLMAYNRASLTCRSTSLGLLLYKNNDMTVRETNDQTLIKMI